MKIPSSAVWSEVSPCAVAMAEKSNEPTGTLFSAMKGVFCVRFGLSVEVISE